MMSSSLSPQLAAFAIDVFRLCIWLVLLTAIFIPVERLFARTPGKFLRPQIGNDLAYYFLSSLLPAVLLSLPLALLATAAQRLLPAGYLAWIAAQPLWLTIPAGLVVADIGSYWGHRWSHEIPMLWRFHVIHHSAEHIDYLVNGRAHPVDMVVTRLAGLIPLYFLGLANSTPQGSMVPVVIALVGTLASFFVHANVRWRLGPIEWLVATPAFHHWHHSRTDHIDHNYAATFPWIDRMFGSHYLPAHFPADYGVTEAVPAGLVEQLAHPFRRRETLAPTPVTGG